MKIRHTLWTIPLLGMLAIPAAALADRYHDDRYEGNRFEQRLDRQHLRIKQGVRSGELTRKEARRLRKQQRHIARLESRFLRDGYLNRHERRTLRRKLDAASDRIYRLKHNDRYRDHSAAPYTHGERYGYRDGWSIGLSLWDHL